MCTFISTPLVWDRAFQQCLTAVSNQGPHPSVEREDPSIHWPYSTATGTYMYMYM